MYVQSLIYAHARDAMNQLTLCWVIQNTEIVLWDLIFALSCFVRYKCYRVVICLVTFDKINSSFLFVFTILESNKWKIANNTVVPKIAARYGHSAVAVNRWELKGALSVYRSSMTPFPRFHAPHFLFSTVFILFSDQHSISSHIHTDTRSRQVQRFKFAVRYCIIPIYY